MKSQLLINYSYNAAYKQNKPLIYIEKGSTNSKYVKVVYDLGTSIYYLQKTGVDEIKNSYNYYKQSSPSSFMKSDTYYSFNWTYGVGPYMTLPMCKKFAEDVKNTIANPDHIISLFDLLKRAKTI
ncbi:hypothetical protein [Methanobacterium sp. MBAC-LM]|uniref:hypothetical protein n=1 Tax=Methanobacterium sp. MBAC-LM TaxID=3412034 RepID=UPI003C7454C7